jgi:hypothetical protein
MTVAELISRLREMPQDAEVVIVYDSQVMSRPAEFVCRWRLCSDEVAVGIFDEVPEPDDDGVVRN